MRTFRLKQKSYVVGERYEEGPGSACDVVHDDGGTTILWRGEAETEPDAKFFEDMGIDLPADENEERGGEPGNPTTGDAEYSYLLQELIDEKWRYANHLHATRS